MQPNFNTSQFHNLSMMPPPTINGHPIQNIIGTPAQPPAGSLQYVFTQNYNAEKPKPGPGEATNMQYVAPKKFAKGDVVLGIKLPNGKIITVGQGPYDITAAVIEYKQPFVYSSNQRGVAQYRFIKDASMQGRQANPLPNAMYAQVLTHFKKGEIVQGRLMGSPAGIVGESISFEKDGQIYNTGLSWGTYLERVDNSSNSGPSIFKKQYLTPKNILIGGLALAVIILIARRRT